jgi:hypothetical protein
VPLFKRKPKAPPALIIDLPQGELCERGVQATLLQGKTAMRGALYMTNRRLMFQATKGDARWLVVPFDEVKSAGVYPAPRATMGAPGASARSLFIETTKGEHVWWSFDAKEQDAWLPTVRERAEAAAKARDGE